MTYNVFSGTFNPTQSILNFSLPQYFRVYNSTVANPLLRQVSRRWHLASLYADGGLFIVKIRNDFVDILLLLFAVVKT